MTRLVQRAVSSLIRLVSNQMEPDVNISQESPHSCFGKGYNEFTVPLLEGGYSNHLNYREVFYVNKDGHNIQKSMDHSPGSELTNHISQLSHSLKGHMLRQTKPAYSNDLEKLERDSLRVDLDCEMEGGAEKDKDSERDNETQQSKEEKAPEIPSIGFIVSTDANNEEDILMSEEYFATATSLYHMVREPRDIFVSRIAIQDQKKRFGQVNKVEDEFPKQFIKEIQQLVGAKDLSVIEFTKILCKSNCGFGQLRLHRLRVDNRLTLDQFPAILNSSIVAWGLYQTILGHYILGPIFTTQLLLNVYLQQKNFELIFAENKKWGLICLGSWLLNLFFTFLVLLLARHPIIGISYLITSMVLAGICIGYFIQKIKLPQKLSSKIAGSQGVFEAIAIQSIQVYSQWIAISITFDFGSYFAPGLLVFLLMIFFVSKEIKSQKYADISSEYSDENQIVSLNKVNRELHQKPEKPGFLMKFVSTILIQIKPFVDLLNQVFFQYKMYEINRTTDLTQMQNGEDGQMHYKLVGFAYLVLNIGPHLIDYSQTIFEMLASKNFQESNWKRKSKCNRICLWINISPLGPLQIFIKKFLRLIQGISNLIISLAEIITSSNFENKKQSIDNLFDSLIEKYFGEQPQSKIGRIIQQKMSGLYFRDLAILIMNSLIIIEVIHAPKIFEDKQSNYSFMFQLVSGLISLILGLVQIIILSEAHGQKFDHYALISMIGSQGFYPLEQFIRKTPEFSIDFQNLQYKQPFLYGLFGKVHCWQYFFSDMTLKKLKNDLIEASMKEDQPLLKKFISIRDSLQYVSLNVYLDFVNTLISNDTLTVRVDILENPDLGSELFQQLIQNAQNKNIIQPHYHSQTDTGKSLQEITENLGLIQLKETIQQIENQTQIDKPEITQQIDASNTERLLSDHNKNFDIQNTGVTSARSQKSYIDYSDGDMEGGLIQDSSISRQPNNHANYLMLVFMVVAETIATTDFGSDLILLKNLLITQHTAWCWLTMLQMIFCLLICQIPLINMLVHRNNLGSDKDTMSLYQKMLATISTTTLIIPLLVMLDIFFMVITVTGGYVAILLLIISCGRIKMECYMIIQDKIFYWVFNMSKNDIEGFRRARNINQLLFETVPQVFLQTRILLWIYNHPDDKISKYVNASQLLVSIGSGIVHAMMESFQIYNEARAAGNTLLQYAVVCMNGRFDWLPFEETIHKLILEKSREQDQQQNEIVLNLGELSTKVCGMEFDLEIKTTGAGLVQLAALFYQMKPIKDQQTIVWIEFGDSISYQSISPEMLSTYFLAVENKVKMSFSEIKKILLGFIKFHPEVIKRSRGEPTYNKKTLFDEFAMNGFCAYNEIIMQEFEVDQEIQLQTGKLIYKQALEDPDTIKLQDALNNNDWSQELIDSIQSLIKQSKNFQSLIEVVQAIEQGKTQSFQLPHQQKAMLVDNSEEYKQFQLKKFKLFSIMRALGQQTSFFCHEKQLKGTNVMVQFTTMKCILVKHTTDFVIDDGATMIQDYSQQFIYICGGENNNGKRLLKVCSKTLDAARLPDNKRFRRWHSTCWLGQHQIVVTGGIGKGKRGRGGVLVYALQEICELFDCQKVCWTELPKLNEKRRNHSSCSFNNNTVYVFGGHAQATNQFVNAIEKLVIEDQSWTIIESKGDSFIDHFNHKSTTINDDFILIFGGQENKNTFKFYPETQQIEQVDDMVDYCSMASCTEPVYDKFTEAFYVTDSTSIHKFDRHQKWSIVARDIRQNII